MKRTLLRVLVVIAAVILLGALFVWVKFFRVVEGPPLVAANGHTAEDMRFLYGSIGGERDAGIPYWIFYVLPRVFPDKLPGPGGYASLGIGWEQGQELPIGFTKKTIGFARVGNNCAICHAASFRTKANENPTYFPAAPNHSFDLENFFRFLVDCAKDSRFSSQRLMAEINLSADLSWIDQQLYRYILIPVTKKRLVERQEQFRWIYLHGDAWPEWGRGRDDAMNLTKYFLTTAPLDDTLGPSDMPSVWNIKKYDPRRNRMNFAGDSYDARSVIIDSALGLLGAPPPRNRVFLEQVDWLHDYLGRQRAPKFPFPIDATKAARGANVFARECARCHRSARTGTVVPVGEVGTDANRLASWNRQAAINANRAVQDMGIERRGLVEADPTGYVAAYLDGIWLRAPYLHNGSVPTLRALLEPAASRPRLFYRGYDVYDPLLAGFVATPEQASRLGVPWPDVLRFATPYDVARRSCGNQGHEYGVTLPANEKDALVEYLKTL